MLVQHGFIIGHSLLCAPGITYCILKWKCKAKIVFLLKFDKGLALCEVQKSLKSLKNLNQKIYFDFSLDVNLFSQIWRFLVLEKNFVLYLIAENWAKRNQFCKKKFRKTFNNLILI